MRKNQQLIKIINNSPHRTIDSYFQKTNTSNTNSNDIFRGTSNFQSSKAAWDFSTTPKTFRAITEHPLDSKLLGFPEKKNTWEFSQNEAKPAVATTPIVEDYDFITSKKFKKKSEIQEKFEPRSNSANYFDGSRKNSTLNNYYKMFGEKKKVSPKKNDERDFFRTLDKTFDLNQNSPKDYKRYQQEEREAVEAKEDFMGFLKNMDDTHKVKKSFLNQGNIVTKEINEEKKYYQSKPYEKPLNFYEQRKNMHKNFQYQNNLNNIQKYDPNHQYNVPHHKASGNNMQQNRPGNMAGQKFGVGPPNPNNFRTKENSNLNGAMKKNKDDSNKLEPYMMFTDLDKQKIAKKNAQKFKEENQKLEAERERILKDAKTREKMLEEGKSELPTYNDHFDEFETSDKSNFDHLIQYLVCFDYDLTRERKQINPEEIEKIPDCFESAYQYRAVFQKLLFKECSESVKNCLLDLKEHNNWPETTPLKLKVMNDNAGLGDFVYFDLAHYEKENAAESIDKKIFDLAFSRNYLVLISNEKNFDLDLLKDRDFKTKGRFCFLAFMSSEEKKANNMFPKLKSMIKLEKFKFRFLKTEWIDIFIHPVEKMTTFIREYLGLRSLHLNEISAMIFDPKITANSHKIANPNLIINYFKNMEAHYNETQLKSIKEICLTSEGISLLQGPPGTGKTFTLMGIISGIYHYIKNTPGTLRRHIMICAPSNAAIDEIITRLVRYGLLDEEGKAKRVRVVRIGILDKNPTDLVKSVSLENLAQGELFLQNNKNKIAENTSTIQLRDEIEKITRQIDEARKNPETSKTQLDGLYEKRRSVQSMYTDIKHNKILMREKYNEIMKRLLSTAEIICCTLGSAGSDKLELFRNNIEAVIVDEASQCVELSNIIPLQYSVKRFILIGDPKQLMATTYSPDSNDTKYNRSLFERFIDNGIQPHFLDIQYRMHPHVREFPSKLFYQDRLRDSDSVIRREFPSYLKCFESINNLFIDLPYSREELADYSFLNNDEARVALLIIKRLIRNIPANYKSANTIGFISPYKRQTRLFQDLINRELEGNYSKSIQINTVDSFQGQEKDIIIFSTVRSSNKDLRSSEPTGNLIGFLSDERRMNVAITRARYVLIIIGNSKTLSTNMVWRKMMLHMKKNKMFSNFGSIEDFEKSSEIIFTHGYIPSSNIPLRLEFPKIQSMSLAKRIILNKNNDKHSTPVKDPSGKQIISASKHSDTAGNDVIEEEEVEEGEIKVSRQISAKKRTPSKNNESTPIKDGSLKKINLQQEEEVHNEGSAFNILQKIKSIHREPAINTPTKSQHKSPLQNLNSANSNEQIKPIKNASEESHQSSTKKRTLNELNHIHNSEERSTGGLLSLLSNKKEVKVESQTLAFLEKIEKKKKL